MSLSVALNNALIGMRTEQRSAEVASRNVANASTPGYSAKRLPRTTDSLGNLTFGSMTREINTLLQKQLRSEQSSLRKIEVSESFMGRLEEHFGKPDGDTTLASSVTNIISKLQELADNPRQGAAKLGVIDAARQFTRDINALSDSIQGLRQEAENAISASVAEVNGLLADISKLNGQITGAMSVGDETVTLVENRDNLISKLSEQIDIRVFERSDGASVIYTTSGRTLLDGQPVPLEFDRHPHLSPTSAYDTDATVRGVGTISQRDHTGAADLLATGAIGNGRLAGYIQARDELLPKAQQQLDELASAITSVLETTPPSPGLRLFEDGPSGGQIPFDPASAAQKTGYAARIQVSDDVVADPSLLVMQDPAQAEGDNALPPELIRRLKDATTSYDSATGIGAPNSPFSGSIESFAGSIVAYQSAKRSSLENDLTFQSAVTEGLQRSFDSESGVNVDEEMQSLLDIQNSYAANARVMQTVQQMLDTLIEMM